MRKYRLILNAASAGYRSLKKPEKDITRPVAAKLPSALPSSSIQIAIDGFTNSLKKLNKSDSCGRAVIARPSPSTTQLDLFD